LQTIGNVNALTVGTDKFCSGHKSTSNQKAPTGCSRGGLVLRGGGKFVAVVLLNLNSEVAEVFFVAQVSEVDLRERNTQIFCQRANLKGIQRDVNGCGLILVVEGEEDNMPVKPNRGVDVFVSDAAEERAHEMTSFHAGIF